MIIIPIKWLFHWEYTWIYPIFKQTHIIISLSISEKKQPPPCLELLHRGSDVPLARHQKAQEVVVFHGPWLNPWGKTWDKNAGNPQSPWKNAGF